MDNFYIFERKLVSGIEALPEWNGTDELMSSEVGKKWLAWLETRSVFFSSPLDLDFAMLRRYGEAYGLTNAELAVPEPSTLTAVLGKKRHGVDQYSEEHQKHFAAYHKRYKLGSKPVAHLEAMGELDDKELIDKMPPRIARMIDAVEALLKGLPE